MRKEQNKKQVTLKMISIQTTEQSEPEIALKLQKLWTLMKTSPQQNRKAWDEMHLKI